MRFHCEQSDSVAKKREFITQVQFARLHNTVILRIAILQQLRGRSLGVNLSHTFGSRGRGNSTNEAFHNTRRDRVDHAWILSEGERGCQILGCKLDRGWCNPPVRTALVTVPGI